MNEPNLQEFRQSLGTAADEFTDAELIELQREMYALAELLLDIYFDRKQAGAHRQVSPLTDAPSCPSMKENSANKVKKT